MYQYFCYICIVIVIKSFKSNSAGTDIDVVYDLYNVDGKIYFGEMTFTSCAGHARWQPFEWDERLGRLI